MGWWAGCWSRSRGRERPGTQSGRVSSERVFSGPAVREIQDELPCLAGEPSRQETKRRWRVRSRTGTTLGGRGWSRPIPWWAVQGPCFTRHRCNPHVHMSSGQLDVLHPAMPAEVAVASQGYIDPVLQGGPDHGSWMLLDWELPCRSAPACNLDIDSLMAQRGSARRGILRAGSRGGLLSVVPWTAEIRASAPGKGAWALRGLSISLAVRGLGIQRPPLGFWPPRPGPSRLWQVRAYPRRSGYDSWSLGRSTSGGPSPT